MSFKPRYKLIACDLDGTLLASDGHTIPERNLEAIRAAREAGVLFVPSTGRPASSIDDTLEQLNMDEGYILALNGAIATTLAAEVLFKQQALPFEKAEALWKAGVDYNICMHVYSTDRVWGRKLDADELDYLDGRMGIIPVEDSDLDFMRNEWIVKTLYESRDLELLGRIEDELRSVGMLDNLDVYRSSERYLEFNPLGVNKGVGLRKLCEYLGISLEETITIGDSSNDIPALEVSGIGAAVRGSSEDALAAANFVCTSTNDEGAVGEVIEKFILN